MRPCVQLHSMRALSYIRFASTRAPLRTMSTTPNPQVLVVLIATPPTASDALARALVESRVAACVNRLPGVRSTYRWNNAVEVDDEEMLVVKTTRAAFPRLEEIVRREHPYDVPEIIGMDAVVGSRAYLDWVAENVGEVDGGKGGKGAEGK